MSYLFRPARRGVKISLVGRLNDRGDRDLVMGRIAEPLKDWAGDWKVFPPATDVRQGSDRDCGGLKDPDGPLAQIRCSQPMTTMRLQIFRCSMSLVIRSMARRKADRQGEAGRCVCVGSRSAAECGKIHIWEGSTGVREA
jgi:hypothetical protein